jgi:hypothetical protein
LSSTTLSLISATLLGMFAVIDATFCLPLIENGVRFATIFVWREIQK